MMIQKRPILFAVAIAVTIVTLVGCGNSSGGSGMSTQEAADFRAKQKAREQNFPARPATPAPTIPARPGFPPR